MKEQDQKIKADLTRDEHQVADERRRAFLRKSVYAAYATPVIMALLVDNASAAKSDRPGWVWCPKHQNYHKAPAHY